MLQYNPEKFVEHLYKGEAKKQSSEDKAGRGSGLPEMLKIFRHPSQRNIEVFLVVTNNVIFDAATVTAKRLDFDFSGTFYYFTLNYEKGDDL